MHIYKISEASGITYTGYGNDCGGFKPAPKGKHLDDQTEAFKGCKRKKSKKKSFNLSEYKKIAIELPGGGVKECKECGNKIRNDQKKCPKCGEPNPNYWKAYGE